MYANDCRYIAMVLMAMNMFVLIGVAILFGMTPLICMTDSTSKYYKSFGSVTLHLNLSVYTVHTDCLMG